MKRAVFLDRDGVINEDYGYVGSIERFVFLPGALDALKRLSKEDVLVIVVTNQAGVAHGLYERSDVINLHSWIDSVGLVCGFRIDRFYFCPHHPEALIDEYKANCDSRKPNPGMVVNAKHDFNINLEESFLIGDKEIDVRAGMLAGIPRKNLYLVKSRYEIPPGADVQGVIKTHDLYSAIDSIIIQLSVQ